MTKQEFLVLSGLLSEFDLDELDTTEFLMRFEMDAGSRIPDDWFAEASLPRPEERTDWSAFRREAAKDILAGIMSCPSTINIGDTSLRTVRDHVTCAVEIADELIKQLKKDKK